MIHKVKTFTNLWLQWYKITIEADLNRALPSIEIIWLPDAAIRESKERIRATFRHVNIELPRQKIILNLSPSDTKKVWTSFDLPMAIAILLLIKQDEIKHPDLLFDSIFFGELWLDWEIKRVNWLIPSVINAIQNGYKKFFVPYENIYELEYIPWITIYPLKSFSQIIEYFVYDQEIHSISQAKNIDNIITNTDNYQTDFEYIKWQIIAKRALSIAVAWLHNILMVWAPWSGKTLLSKALQSILPPLDFQEILEISQIYSVVGKLNKDMPLITSRPFRQIHHTASKISITWWWSNLTPWEVSLAHKWILFFDELTEFPREVLEVLRQPLEDQSIVISRVSGTIHYPANFMFVASMNPCKCWYYKDREKPCVCTHNDIKKYQSKISWPLLDRIDMILEIPRENIDKILDTIKWENSLSIKQKVINAWQIQQKRFAQYDIFSNSQITSKHIDELIPLDQESKNFLSQASKKLTLSPRVVHRTIKLARTIADMQSDEHITINHLAEAMQYRSKTMFIDSE